MDQLMAQNPGWWHITDQDGLPGSTIHDIVQDDDGYMWMATNGGLCRFDGRDFKVYEDLGFQDNEILKLKKDNENRLWFVNVSGELSYLQDDVVSDFSDQVGLGNRVLNFWHLQKGILVGSLENSSAIKLSWYLRNKKSKNYTLLDEVKIPCINNRLEGSLASTSKGEIFYAYVNYVNAYSIQFENNKLLIVSYPYSKNANSYPNSIPKDVKNTYVAGKKTLYKIDSSRLFKVKKYSQIQIIKVIETEDRTVISRLDHPALSFNKNTGELENLPAFNGLNDITALLKDTEGNHWIGTSSRGVFIVPDLDENFYNSSKGLLNNSIFDINGRDSLVFVGQKSGALTVFKDGKIHQSIAIEGASELRSIGLDEENLFLSFGNKMLTYSTNETIKSKKSNSSRIENRAIKTTIIDKKYVFVATAYGVYRVDREYVTNAPPAKLLTSKRTYGLVIDNKGILWIGTIDGLYYYVDDELFKFNQDKLKENYNVSNLAVSEDGSIWATLNNIGLIRIMDKEIIESFDVEDGLASNTCSSLMADRDTLWIGTNKGVNKLIIGEGIVSKLDISSGLISNEVTSVFSSKNDIWIGTPIGLSVIPRSKFLINKPKPSIRLTNVLVNGVFQNINAALDLSHSQNDIEIAYTGFSYSSRGKETYKYRMLGLDTTWHETPNRSASYYGLGHGEYTFEVTAISTHKISSEVIAKIDFNIAQLWWKKWWVQLIGLLAFLGILFYLFSRRQSRLLTEERKDKEYQKRIEQLKMHALQSQMNPHFIFNTLNGIQDFLLSKNNDKALKSLTDFSRMISFIFENSGKKSIALSQELEFLDHYLSLEKMRFEDKITIELHVDKSIEAQKNEIYLPPLLLQPIIENAFQHGLHHKLEKSNLTINIEKSNKSNLKCTIIDNGVGRKKSKEIQAKSIKHSNERSTSGLTIIAERVAIFHEIDIGTITDFLKFTDLTDSNGMANGTKVEIWL